MAVQDENGFQPVIDRFEDDVLSLAYYMKDRDVICGFLPDSVTYGVHSDLWVLTAVEELVSGSRLDKIGEAVSMLEYLHSRYPDLGEEREYVNLIVDMKTKASTYELFFAGVVSESDKQAILDKYFDPDLCNSQLPPPDLQTDYSELSDEQYNLTIHSVARNGIFNMMSSSERCRQFQQTIMNPLYSPAIHENLLKNLCSYLDQIKRQLPVPALLQSFAATHSNQSHRSRTLTTETRPRVMADDSDYSQPPLLDEPTTSGQHLHVHPSPPPFTDSSTEKKKLPPVKPVKVRIIPCRVKQPPSQQPLFESSVSHQSDPGSEATITYESDSVKRSAYQLRERKHQSLSSSSSSEDEDVFKNYMIEHSTKIRRSPRQKAAQRRKVNGIKESVYKDLSSSEIENIEDLESMGTVSSGAEDSTELSDSPNLSQSTSKEQLKSMSVGETPTRVRKSARLRDLESGSRRMSPKKMNSSSELETSRKLKAVALELIRSERKRDLEKAEFQTTCTSPHTRDSSLESESSRNFRATALELRRSKRKRDLNKDTSSPHKRDSSLESESSRKRRATTKELRRSERKRDLDKATSSSHKRDSSLESESSRKLRATTKELRRSERKRDLDKATSSPHKRDSSIESESSKTLKATALELRGSERKRDLEKAANSPHKRDSSLESESSRKLRATVIELRRSERKRDLDEATGLPHERDSSLESESSRKFRATVIELRRSERKRDLDKREFQVSSPHRRDSSLDSQNSRKSRTTKEELRRSERKRELTSSPHKDGSSESESTRSTVMKLKRSERKQGIDSQTWSPHQGDSSSESESTEKFRATTMKLGSERNRCLDSQTSSPHKRDSSSKSESTKESKATAVELRRSRRKPDLTSSPHKRDGSLESKGMRKSRARAMKLRNSKGTQDSDKANFQTHSPHKRDSSSESGSRRTTARKLKSSREKQDSDKVNFQTCSPHKRDSSSESGSRRTTAIKLKSSREKQDSNKVDFQAHSPYKRDRSSEEESKLRRSKQAKHSIGDHKTSSPKKKPSSASHTESDSESESALSTHHQYILRQREKDIPVKHSNHYLRSQTQASNVIVSEQKSKFQSLLTSKSDQSGIECEMEKEGSHSEKRQFSLRAAGCANLLQKVIDFISETDHDNSGDDADAMSHDTTEAKKLLTKHSKDTDQERKDSGNKSKDRSHPSSKQSNKSTPPAATKSAMESNKELPSQTTSISTNAAAHCDNELVQKNTAISNFSGLRLRSHPGNKRPSPSTASTQASVTQSSPSAMTLRSGKASEGHYTKPRDLTSKQNQRETAVVPTRSKDIASGNEQQGTSSPTKALVDNKKVRKRRKDGNPGLSSVKDNKNRSFSTSKSKHDRSNNDSSVKRSPRKHASSTAQESLVQQQQGGNSSPMTERRSEQLAHAKDICSPSSQRQAIVQSTHEHDTHIVATDLVTNSRTETSDNALQRSPANAQKSSAKVLSLDEARASLSPSLPHDFKRPKKRLNFSQDDSGADSDSSVRNAVKRVRFATSLDSGELSETDTILLAAASESRQEQESPRKNPTVDALSNIEISSTGSSLQLASEITVSSNVSDSTQPPSLSSYSTSSNSKKRSRTKTKKMPRIPPTQLSQRGDEGAIWLPSPPVGKPTALRCDTSDTTQNGGTSGIHTVLSQVSQLQPRRGRPRQSNRQRSTSQNKARSKTASRKAKSPREGARSPSTRRSASRTSKSPQINKEDATSSGSMYGTTAHENTRTPRKRGRLRKTESGDKDESTTKPPIPKKRRKEHHTSDVSVSSGRDSASSSKSPKGRNTGENRRSSGSGRSPKSSNKERCSLSGSRGAGSSNKEHHSSGGGVKDARNCDKEHCSSGGRGPGDSHSGEIPANYGSQRAEPCASTSRDTTIASTTSYHGSQGGALSMGNPSTTLLTHQQRFPVLSRDTGPSYGGTNIQCHASPGKSVSSQVDDVNQSPEIDIVGFTPEYSEPAEAVVDDVVGSQGQGHTQTTLGYQSTSSNTDRQIVMHPPHTSTSGHPHTNPSVYNQLISSNMDRLISTYSPYISISGRPPINLPNYHPSSPSNTGRLVHTHPSYTSNSGRPHTNLSNSTPSNTDRLVSMHPPYNIISSDGSNLSRYYHENSPGNSPVIGLMNHSQVPHNIIKTTTPHSSKQQHPQSSRSTNVWAYPQDETSGHKQMNLTGESSRGNSPVIGLMNRSQITHNIIKTTTPYSSKQQHPQSLRSANLGTYPQDETSRHRQLNLTGKSSRDNSPVIGLMNHLPFIKATTHYSSRQQQQQSNIATSGHEQLNLIDDEYELSQVQSQYYHAPVQRLAQQMPNYSDNESIVSESAVSSNGTPVPTLHRIDQV